MENSIRDNDIPLEFVSKYREFGIKILDGGTSFLIVNFCPWCGEKLPDSLRDEWFDKLELMGVDPYNQKNIPIEYRDEQWYLSK